MSDADRFNQGVSGSDSAESEAPRAQADVSAEDEKILKRVREDYKFCLDYWEENREEAAKDMQFVAAEFWTREEIDKRRGRPCLGPDEISQYLKQANNNLRQNKRAVKVIPRGDGSSDEDALKRAAIIRGIEHASNAQAAYTTAFEGANEGFLGAWRITTKQMPNGGAFAVEPRIKRIPNPFTILLDPEAKEADFSDQNLCFVTDALRESTFARKYPNAVKTSFSKDDRKLAPDWFKGNTIIVAEYWTRTAKTRKRLKVKGQAGDTTVYEDELQKGDKPEVLDSRDETEHTVTQYITNGVEILEKNDWPGSWIPIIPVLAEEIYTNDGGQSKRKFISLVRRARVPQKMLCFIASQEAEEFGMAPRSPLMVWEGQEAADKKALQNLNTDPVAYVRIKPTYGQNGELLPAPSRLPFTPNIEAYEAAMENWRRKVQAAMSGSPLPTDAQRQNQKSGIALEKIDSSEAIGNYHMTDNLDRALENSGRQLNELITEVMDTPRTVGTRGVDDKHGVLKVMAQEYAAAHAPQQQEQSQPAQTQGPPQPDSENDYLITDRGEFDVTISTGASYESQREESSDFADTILKTVEGLAQLLPQGAVAKLLALAIKLKDIGHIGDEMAEIISPEDQTGQQLALAQQQLAQGQQAMAEMKAELDKLKLEKAGKVIDNQFKGQFHQMQLDVDQKIAQLNADLKAYIANVQTKAQDAAQRNQLFQETQTENHHAAHELGLQKDQQAHEHSIADKQAATAALTQASDQVHQQTMAQQTAPDEETNA